MAVAQWPRQLCSSCHTSCLWGLQSHHIISISLAPALMETGEEQIWGPDLRKPVS